MFKLFTSDILSLLSVPLLQILIKQSFAGYSYLQEQNINITCMNSHIVIKFYSYKHRYVHQHIH